MLSLVDAERSYLLSVAPGAVASDSLQDLQAKFWTKTATESLADAETRYLKALLSNEAAGDTLADLRRKDLIIKTGATSGSDSELKALYLGVPTVKNLLTANQASGGDTLQNTIGFYALGVGTTVNRNTTYSASGLGCIEATCLGSLSGEGLDTASGNNGVQVNDMIPFSIRVKVRASVSGTYNVGVYMYGWGANTPVAASLTAGEWKEITQSLNNVDGAMIGRGWSIQVTTQTARACNIAVDELSLHKGIGSEWAMP